MAARTERILAAFLAAGCLAVLITAAALAPDPEGHGTHEQLGLPACGWAAFLDQPCPTCGMTTAFSAAANRRPLQAVAIQPMGAVLALATATLFWGAAHVAVFGSSLGRFAGGLFRPRMLWVAGGVFAAAWVYKIVTWSSGGGGGDVGGGA